MCTKKFSSPLKQRAVCSALPTGINTGKRTRLVCLRLSLSVREHIAHLWHSARLGRVVVRGTSYCTDPGVRWSQSGRNRSLRPYGSGILPQTCNRSEPGRSGRSETRCFRKLFRALFGNDDVRASCTIRAK